MLLLLLILDFNAINLEPMGRSSFPTLSQLHFAHRDMVVASLSEGETHSGVAQIDPALHEVCHTLCPLPMQML